MLQRLLKVNVVYAIGSTANGAALFLLIPFLVKYLGTSDFGLWSLSEIAIYFLTLVILAGMDVYLMREYWFLKSEPERKLLVGTMLSMVIIWGTGIIILLTVVVVLFFKNGIFFNQFDPALLILICAIGCSEVVFTLLLSIFRIQEKPFHFVFLSVGRMAMFMGTAIFWMKTGAGLDGALAGRLTAAIVFILVAWGMARKYVQMGFSSKYLRPWSNYGLPMVLFGLVFYILISADRYIVQVVAGLQAVAIYSFSYKIAASIDYLVTRPFGTDWAARRFWIATQAQPERQYAQSAVFYTFIALWCALLVQAAAPLLYKWFAPSVYLQGLNALPILLVANIAMGLSYPLNVGIMLKDRTKLLVPIAICASVVYIIALLLLVPSNPIQGAAWATLLAYSTYTTGITIISLRLYPVNYPIRAWGTLGVCAILAAMGIFLLSFFDVNTPLWITVLARGLWVFLVFALTGYFLWKSRIGFTSLEKADLVE
jgi:O-antigen/teichoic acid export membrane protein